MNYIEDVPEDKVFILGEKRIKNLYGLLFEFREMSDETYGYYASADHNYFADWVQHVLENSDIADKMRSTGSRKEGIEVLESAVEKIRNDMSPKEEKRESPVIEEEKQELVAEAEKEPIPEKKIEVENRKAIEKEEETLTKDLLKDKKEARIFLFKHFGREMASEFMLGMGLGIIIGLILGKMFFG